MGRHQWIVSDPPHREVDLGAAAKLLGLAQSEARMKVNFWAPEVWLAHSEADLAAEVAAALRDAGLNVSILSAEDLLSVPPPTAVHSFSFADAGFVAVIEGEEAKEVHLPYDTPLIGSFCRPPADFASGDPQSASRSGSGRSALGQSSTGAYIKGLVSLGSSAQQTVDMLERRANLDLYFQGEAGLDRLSFAEGVVDFSGLGDAIRPRVRDNMDLLLDECERRFGNLVLDRRMVNVRPRRRLTVGSPAEVQEMRKLLTFGTVGLQSLLESVSQELADITQYELGSRLAYLIERGRDPGGA